jgi:RHS repeat-associated protein
VAFGEMLNESGTTENSYRYTGEQFDSNLNQYYLRARYYNQGVGRFTQMDTWMGNDGDPITLHKYLYANVDPVNGSDPSGYVTMTQLMGGLYATGTVVSIGHTTFTYAINISTGNYVAVAVDAAVDIGGAVVAGPYGKPLRYGLEKLAAFGNRWARGAKLKLGFDADSTVLRENLKMIGVHAPPGTAAHHIVEGGDAAAEAARNILRRYDIDINSPMNGVFLPTRSAAGDVIGAPHIGRHANSYSRVVSDRLHAAAPNGKEAVLQALAELKGELLESAVLLNRAQR